MQQHKLLIIDDDEVTLSQLHSALSGIAQIFLAKTGQAALALARDIQPNLILLDLGLPDMDGYDVMNTLKHDGSLSHIPIIVISSRSKFTDYGDSIYRGAVGYFEKPFDNQLLLNSVKDVLIKPKKCVKPTEMNLVSKERFTNLINMLSEAVVITNSNGKIELVNQFGLNLFGYDKNELLGQNVKVLTPDVIAKKHDDYIQSYNQTGQAHLIGNPRELEAKTKSGDIIHIELNLSEYLENDTRYYLGLIRDITEKKAIQARLFRAAMYDPLTGLNNNLSFTLDLDKLTSTESKEGFIYAMMLDIVDFQSLNTVMGYERCDALLVSIADILSSLSTSHNCRAYRLMSDRFLIYGVDASEAEAKAKKNDLISAVNQRIEELNDRLEFSIVITSVCLLQSLAMTQAFDLKSKLELFLIQARRNGDNGLTSSASSEADFLRGLEFAALKISLQSAVDYSLLSVALQPKVYLNGEICGFEALLRWDNRNHRNLYLQDFIEAAEASSAIVEIGYFVIKRVCKFLTSLPIDKRKQIFINLSIKQIIASDFLESIENICSQFDMPKKYIGFEVTESMVSDDIEFVANRLFSLQESGFALAVDDFGTGQSNLRYLHKLPLSELKIDKTYIDDITDATKNYPLVEGIFRLARSMDLIVTAEGVEQAEQVAYLTKLGVDKIQGFYFFKPMPMDECAELIHSISVDKY
ncbi:MAG: EAL domain-containing protein [Methylophaga sp.]|nr:EAL domain-containing protein [Methylophaga sp.]